MKKRVNGWVRRIRIAGAAASAVAVCSPAAAAMVADAPAPGGWTDAGETSPPVALEVVGDRLNVRARPGTRYEIVCQVLRGDRVTAVGEEEGWREILAPPGSTVWVHGAFVQDGQIIGDRVNLRAGPSLSYSVVGRVTRGMPVEGRSEYNEWIEILPPAGVTFWVSGEFLRPVEAAAVPSDTTRIRTFTPPDEPGVERIRIPEPHEAEAADPPAAVAMELRPDPPGEAADPPAAPEEADLTGETVAAVPADPAAGMEFARLPPAQPEARPMVLPESEIEWLGPPRDVALIGEIHRTGFLVRRPGSHKLIQRNGRRARLVCYLRSDEVELDRFLGKNVRLVGAEQWAKGWPRPVVHVRQVSIQW